MRKDNAICKEACADIIIKDADKAEEVLKAMDENSMDRFGADEGEE